MLDECAQRARAAANRALPDERGVHRQPDDRLDREGQAARAARAGDGDDQRRTARARRSPTVWCASGLDAIWFSFNGATPRDLRKDHGHSVRQGEGQHRLPAVGASADAAGLRQHDRDDADGAGDRGEHPLLGEPRRAGRRVAARQPRRQRRQLRELHYAPQAAQPVRICELRVLQDVHPRLWRRRAVLHGLAPRSPCSATCGSKACATSGTATPIGASVNCTATGAIARSRCAASARTRCHETRRPGANRERRRACCS